MQNTIDVRVNHDYYEAHENDQFGQAVDAMFDAVMDVQKVQNGLYPDHVPAFCGDDRAEELVAAITHYLRRCAEK